jgi:glutamate-ammonia-ligase adenylyltransferase
MTVLGQRPVAGSVAIPPEEAFTEAWTKTAQRVRRLHEKLFYRPLLDAVAKLPSGAARLTPEAARARLQALGYRDPAGALRHIEALTSGLRRRAAIQRTLLPVLLGWFADAAEPDAGLLAFRQVSEALGETPWFLRLLRDETKAAERMACVLASSRYATGLLLRAPEAVALFADDTELVPKPADALRAEMMAAARRHVADLSGAGAGADTPAGSAAAARRRLADAEQAAATVRSLRRRELFRVAAANVLGLIGLAETGEALTAITTATLDAVLAVAIAKIEMELRAPLPTRFAVIAMGRYGGHESGFGSDADVIFVHDPPPPLNAEADRRASDAAQAVGAELRRLLQIPAPDPPLVVDADLRPEGRAGPLVRSLGACEAYYTRRAAPWELQALLRAEFAAGDPELGAQFIALADSCRYPAGGLSDTAVREIRRIKARIEAERIPRGTDRALHVKLGPGGLADVEWTVQLLQLQHGHAVGGLRTTRTLAALDAALDAGLVAVDDSAALRVAWRFAARIRNAIMLVRGRPGDSLPGKHDELTAVARLLGYKPNGVGTPGYVSSPVPSSGGAGATGAGGNGGTSWTDTPAAALEEDWRRTGRRARKVMDRLFYG